MGPSQAQFPRDIFQQPGTGKKLYNVLINIMTVEKANTSPYIMYVNTPIHIHMVFLWYTLFPFKVKYQSDVQ